MASAQDRCAIINAATMMMWYIDTRDWDRFPEVFAESVTLDYSGIWGGEPAQVTPAQIQAEWSRLLNAFDATQHLLGNHLVTVDDDSAVLTAVFQAVHLLTNPFGSPRWTLGGTYRIGLTRTGGGWRIHELVMTATWADGNKDILTIASGGIRPAAA
ncbi:nuclear transport factor 2 family protein [Amycolatopsis sp. TNS106]|uniref:nuclear transport factor 2 family protein n=1 Tax=Amycolatopsis sp. TNS106 TaxID=2861750 RepID=UPI001C5740A4|nr:nuclear transport factor 2 family protein [Amycolatopsis sp. TNS106]QXV55745.1 nuclear transport factor 2 family protein [Amycolatopsis sp. TNS106]